MPKITLFTGLLLIATGVGGFAAAGFETKALTALIPAAFGLLIALCGIFAYRESIRIRALHTASTTGLLAFLLPAGRLGMLVAKGEFTWKLGTCMLAAASLIALGYFVICLSSFLKARRARLT